LIARIIISLLLLCSSAWATDQTHSTLPQQNSSFITDLSIFLQREDAQRYADHFVGMVVIGGVDAIGGTLTHTPTALTAYPGGYYITEVGSVTYIANSTCYLIANRVTTGNLATFQRQAGTHYLTDCTSPTKPALPTDSLWLATVVTNGSSVTAYTDLRTRVPYAGSYPLADIPSAGIRGRVVIVTDVNTGTLYWDTGAAWRQVALNPMTQAGDIIVGGTGGVPARLALGSANQFVGVNAAASTLEYKTLQSGDGISISHTAGASTIAAISATPAGSVIPYAGTSAPSSWLLCDGTAYLASTYPVLSVVLIQSAGVWGRGTAVGTFTVDTATDVLTSASHGLIDGQIVHMASTTTLPTGLSSNTVYYVRDSTSSTFRVSLSSGGVAVDITSAGSGTHSVYDEIQVPDLRSRLPIGAGTGTYVENFDPADVNTGTEVITVATNNTLYTGTAVVYTSTGTVVTGLSASATYYIIRASATTIKLASTLANALAGTAINLTGTGTGVHTLTQTLTARSLGSVGGEETHTQLGTEVGIHNHAITDPGHTHNVDGVVVSDTGGAQGFVNDTSGDDTDSDRTSASNTTGITINNTATPVGANVMNPFLALNYIIKQ